MTCRSPAQGSCGISREIYLHLGITAKNKAIYCESFCWLTFFHDINHIISIKCLLSSVFQHALHPMLIRSMLNISPFSRGDPRTPQLRHVGGAPVSVWLNNRWLVGPKNEMMKTSIQSWIQKLDSGTDSVLETEELKLQNSCWTKLSAGWFAI